MDLTCESHLSLSVVSSQHKSLILHLDFGMEKNNVLIHNIKILLGNYLEIYYLKAAGLNYFSILFFLAKVVF